MQVIFEFSVFFASLRIYFTMDAMKNKTIVLTGGGSGGHVIPILALLPETLTKYTSSAAAVSKKHL